MAFKIKFSPQRRDDNLSASVSGDAICINGEWFDFTGMPDGSSIARDDIPCEFIVSDVRRNGVDIEISLLLPHPANPQEEMAFPSPTICAGGSVNVPRQPEGDMEVENVEAE